MSSAVVIKPLKLEDADEVMSWVNDKEVIKNFQHFNKKFTKKEELRYIKDLIKSKNDFVFSIFKKKDNRYLGQTGINQIIWENKLGMLSLIIKKEYWGKGYAQIVIPLILKYAFNKLKLHKVWLMVYLTNKKGRHIYRKLGFKEEGCLREEYYWNGKYHDMIRMGILKSEFRRH